MASCLITNPGNSANTDSIRQAKGELGKAPVPTPTLETNKQTYFPTTLRYEFKAKVKTVFSLVL